MNYFKILAIAWGIIMIGLRLLMHLIPERWNKFELEKAYTEQKPKWLWIIGLFSIIFVLLTWYIEITTDIEFSLTLTLLVTATLIKVSQLVFNYESFRRFVTKALLEERSILIKINMATTILGIILICLGIFVY